MRYPGDVQEVHDQVERICQEVRTEFDGSANQVFLGGLGQGGQLALLAAKSFLDVQISGVIVFGSTLPLLEHVYHQGGIGLKPQPFRRANLRTPVFMGIGVKDNKFPAQLQRLTARILRDQGCEVNEVELPAGHTSALSELPRAAEWIKRVSEASAIETVEDGHQEQPVAYYTWQGNRCSEAKVAEIQRGTWALGGGGVAPFGEPVGGTPPQIHRRLARFLEKIHHFSKHGGDGGQGPCQEGSGGGEGGAWDAGCSIQGAGGTEVLVAESRAEFSAEFCHVQQMMEKWILSSIELGLADMLTPILEAGAGTLVNRAIDDEGHTPLHYAILRKRMWMAKLLVNYGADTNVEDKHGYTPAELAVKVGDIVSASNIVLESRTFDPDLAKMNEIYEMSLGEWAPSAVIDRDLYLH
jgi:predicted esterase